VPARQTPHIIPSSFCLCDILWLSRYVLPHNLRETLTEEPHGQGPYTTILDLLAENARRLVWIDCLF
jgi:hypothetical protein